jgi:hypothetical protein
MLSMHIEPMSALAAMQDFADLQQKAAEVEKAQDRPTLFESATQAIRLLTQFASNQWDVLLEEHRDMLRVLARELVTERKHSWITRQRAKVETWRLISRVGFQGLLKQAAEYENARRDFVSAVFGADERHNEELQSAIGSAVTAAMDPSSRVVLSSKEQLGEWFKRLPS